MKLKVIIHKAEEGGYWAEVPALEGCFSQGETVEELVQNIHEAVEGWLGVQQERMSKGKIEKDVKILELVV